MMALTFVALALGNYWVGWLGGFRTARPGALLADERRVSGARSCCFVLVARRLAHANGE